MGRCISCFGLRLHWIWLVVLVITFTFSIKSPVRAFTASVGQPYHGRLVNGIPFPNQFQGYQLRDADRTFATPELIGSVLDAIDAVRQQNPNTSELFLGDFSAANGGAISHHRSHQNGRDVDMGMYAKSNRSLGTFVPMNEENLDVPKTWCLVENLVRSQRIQYIFVDKRIQRLLYDYALSHGADAAYLERLFGNDRTAIIQHVGNHFDHMHVRFYTPWSTMAARVADGDDQQRMVIEMAQQAYLPKRVNYYVKGNEPSLDALAQSFGVNSKDLCKWNQLRGNDVLTPGACLVFYKRGFEAEPVHLAQSLQPSSVPDAPVVHLAALRPSRTLTDASVSFRDSGLRERKADHPSISSYTVRKGDTMAKVAKQSGMDLKTLCDLNGMKKTAALKPGVKIKIASARRTSPAPDSASSLTNSKMASNSSSADAKKSTHASTGTFTAGKGDTLAKVAKQKGLSLDAVATMNGMKKNTTLKPGQVIKLAKAEPASKPTQDMSDKKRPAARGSQEASSSTKAQKGSKNPQPSSTTAAGSPKSLNASAKAKSPSKGPSLSPPQAAGVSKTKSGSGADKKVSAAADKKSSKPLSNANKSDGVGKIAKNSKQSSKKQVD